MTRLTEGVICRRLHQSNVLLADWSSCSNYLFPEPPGSGLQDRPREPLSPPSGPPTRAGLTTACRQYIVDILTTWRRILAEQPGQKLGQPSKRERFEGLWPARIEKASAAIRRLGNLSTSAYDWEPTEIIEGLRRLSAGNIRSERSIPSLAKVAKKVGDAR